MSQISCNYTQNDQINKRINVLEGCLLNEKNNNLVVKYSQTNKRMKKLLGSSFLKNRNTNKKCIRSSVSKN